MPTGVLEVRNQVQRAAQTQWSQVEFFVFFSKKNNTDWRAVALTTRVIRGERSEAHRAP